MESMKDKVAIVGMGCSAFGELWDKSVDDMIVEACSEAFEDAGVGQKDIQAAYVGTVTNYTGTAVTRALKFQYIPVTRVENECGTGEDVIRNAAFALAARAYDLVLVVAYEKLKDYGYPGLPIEVTKMPGIHPVYETTLTAPGNYALAATRYFDRYGLSREEGKRTLAKISVKSHYNGARNPRAHLRREVTIDQVMNAPIIAWPLGLFDCCGVTDGAVAAIMCRTEDARNFRDDYITIKGLGNAAGPAQGPVMDNYDYTHWEETSQAARQAYEQAGIQNPRKELDMAEVHDCFSIAELIALESLGICERGRGKEDVDAGTFTQEGTLPVNISGGLKSFGHPLGASGCRAVYEIYKQIQGKAQEPSRQLKNIRMGLAHSQGGAPGKFVCGVVIVGVP